MIYIKISYISKNASAVALRTVKNVGLIKTDENKVSVKAPTANTIWIISGITLLRGMFKMLIINVLFKTRLDYTKK